ncbi:MAG: DedA family protein [Acidisphaera sp.]|nr:DedA family protein [Acidisphaera sp.]
MLSHHVLVALLHRYGYGAVGLIIMLESMGMPLPGESLLIAAALYAAATHQIDIAIVVPVAALGAVVGDNIGYLIGRSLGYPLLARHGWRIGLTGRRLLLGQFLFRRHGGKVVFFGRFIAVLRTFAALLAGANRMPWPGFLLFNALGGVTWCCLYGFGAYLLGNAAKRVAGPFGIAIGIAAAAAIIAAVVFLKRNEHRLEAQAEREMAEEPAA